MNRPFIMTRLEEIKERCEKATLGPWEHDGKFQVCIPRKEGTACFRAFPDDAEFIAHSREDIPWLVSQLEKAIELAHSVIAGSHMWVFTPETSEHCREGFDYCRAKAREFLEQMK